VESGSYGGEYKKFWPAVIVITSTAYLIVCIGALFTVIEFRRLMIVKFAVLLLAIYTLPHAIIFGASRFHLPLIPVICLLAAPSLLRLIRRSRLGAGAVAFCTGEASP
jgi:hypothetical protein